MSKTKDDAKGNDLSKPAVLKPPYKSIEAQEIERRSKGSVNEAHLVEDTKTKEKFIRLLHRYKKPYKPDVKIAQGFNIHRGDSLIRLIEIIKKFARKLGWKSYIISKADLDKQAEEISQTLQKKDMEISELQQRLTEANNEKDTYVQEIKKKHEEEIRKLKQDTERIRGLESDLADFKDLIVNFKKEKKTEEDIQKFLDGKKWFFGTNVVTAKPKPRAGATDVFDFLLTYTDGSQKLLELKLPTEYIVDNKGKISAPVTKSLDQLIEYLSQTVAIAHSQLPETQYIKEKKPRGILVIGTTVNNTVAEKIKSWNHALHLVEIKTYDNLIADAENAINQLKSEISK